MDALFADVASAEHSILYHAAIALREARLRMNGPGGLRGPQRGGAHGAGLVAALAAALAVEVMAKSRKRRILQTVARWCR